MKGGGKKSSETPLPSDTCTRFHRFPFNNNNNNNKKKKKKNIKYISRALNRSVSNLPEAQRAVHIQLKPNKPHTQSKPSKQRNQRRKNKITATTTKITTRTITTATTTTFFQVNTHSILFFHISKLIPVKSAIRVWDKHNTGNQAIV